MQKNNEVKFEVLHMPPMNTNSVLVSAGTDAVIFDAWGKATDWEKVLLERGLKLRAIYSTHGHPDHTSAAPALARAFNVDWFLNADDNYLIGFANEFLEMFGLPHIHGDYKKPLNLSAGTMEILPDIKMEIMESPGHTPGGVMFYFPKYKILLIGDTLFQDNVGRYDMPGGNKDKLFESIHNLYAKNLDDGTYVVHGHGMDTTIGWLKKNNQFFK
ncbi:MAG: MBL fold metallo-hydrolase [Alphaproteobacteria bacterium]|nr:MBL fold metallo-hydrolase [Alphaproteobacteria bacterium]